MARWQCPHCGVIKNVFCPQCGAEKAPGAPCPRCGQKVISTICPQCGFEYRWDE